MGRIPPRRNERGSGQNRDLAEFGCDPTDKLLNVCLFLCSFAKLCPFRIVVSSFASARCLRQCRRNRIGPCQECSCDSTCWRPSVPHTTDLDLTSKDVAELTSPDSITAYLAK